MKLHSTDFWVKKQQFQHQNFDSLQNDREKEFIYAV